MKKRIAECVGFQWDEWNSEKNWERHGVSNSECEEAFFNPSLPLFGGGGRISGQNGQVPQRNPLNLLDPT